MSLYKTLTVTGFSIIFFAFQIGFAAPTKLEGGDQVKVSFPEFPSPTQTIKKICCSFSGPNVPVLIIAANNVSLSPSTIKLMTGRDLVKSFSAQPPHHCYYNHQLMPDVVCITGGSYPGLGYSTEAFSILVKNLQTDPKLSIFFECKICG